MRYWEQKVAFQTPPRKLIQCRSSTRKRSWLSLATANKAQAAFEARKLYLQLKANGWQETMQTPQACASSQCASRHNDQRASSMHVHRKHADLPRRQSTAYTRSLRRIATDITSRSGSRDAWNIKLSTLTSEKIEAWRINFVQRASNPLTEKSARVSANSFILRARALFNKETLSRVRVVVEIPEPTPVRWRQGRGDARRPLSLDIRLRRAARERAPRACRACARAVQDFSLRFDGRLAQKRDRPTPLVSVSLRREPDPHRGDRVLSPEVAQQRGRRVRRPRTHRDLSRLSRAAQ